MKEYIVTVHRTDEFKIKIDETKIKNVIKDYNEYFTKKLDKKDEIKDLAKHIGAMAMDNFNRYFEGLGIIVTDDFPSEDTLFYEEERVVKGISIETISTDDIETDIEEIK